MKIVIAGGSGFLGTALSDRWAPQHEVIVLKRRLGAANNRYHAPEAGPAAEVIWDGVTPGEWTKALEGADLLLNLAGKSVNCRYTEANKTAVMQSRVDSTRVLGDAVAACRVPPRVWMNASSATIYPHATGSPRDERFEDLADDFSVQVCKAWEAAFFGSPAPHTRKIALRMAIVLGDDGALVPYTRLARLGLGGMQGSGDQMFSWIHIDDVAGIIEWLLRNDSTGIYNLAAPNAVTNAELMRRIRETVGVPFGIPAPAWLLGIAAAVIGTETELLLKSRWVLPGRLFQEGYRFSFGHIDEALRDLLSKRK